MTEPAMVFMRLGLIVEELIVSAWVKRDRFWRNCLTQMLNYKVEKNLSFSKIVCRTVAPLVENFIEVLHCLP
jgi:hypothetical protein